MSNNKQSSNHIPDVGNMVSSVEFIKNNLERLGMLDNGKVITNIFEQAKEMHKKQTVDFALNYAFGTHEIDNDIKINCHKLYNETFGGNND